MTGITASKLRAARHEQQRQLILQAAAELFGRFGYEGTTIGTIAETLGLSKASLYYYVDSKEALLTELCLDVSRRIMDAAATQTPDGATPEARLRAFLAAHFTVIHAHPAARVLGENLDAVFGPAAGPAMRDARQRHEEALADILSDGTARGHFRHVDARTTARFVLSALNTSTRWYQPGGPRAPDEMANDVADLLMHGVTCAGPPARITGGIE